MSTRPSPYPGAQAVSRAVAVLKAFTDARPHLTLAEVARATRLNRATAYRLLAALEHEGLIARASDDGYHLGSEAIVLGGRALRANDVRAASRPELERLAHATQEAATLEVLAPPDILVLDEVLSPHLIAGAPILGTRWPAHATSTGKAILAHQPDTAVAAFLKAAVNRQTLPRFTERTLTTPAAFQRELAAARERGYATVQDELEVGYAAVAAPVLDYDGRALAALCLGGPTVRLTTARLTEVAPLVLQAARRVSQQLGYRAPSAARRAPRAARGS